MIIFNYRAKMRGQLQKIIDKGVIFCRMVVRLKARLIKKKKQTGRALGSEPGDGGGT